MVISVILCTYNRAAGLRQTLESLRDLALPPPHRWELILVDNNSIDGTRAVAEDFLKTPGITGTYVFEGRQGLSHARNAGIGAATGDVMVFTDDDVTVDRNWLAYLHEAFQRPDCAAVGGKIVPVWTCAKPSWLVQDGPYQLMKVIVSFDLGEATCPLKSPPFGANMAYRKGMFEKYGVFRPDLGRSGSSLMGCEETEFSKRLLDAGESLFYEPRAIVYHPVEPRRLTKRYFQSWYFNYGIARVKLKGTPGPETRGARRGLVTTALKNVVKWIITMESRRRFFHKLQVYLTAGELLESYRAARQGHVR
jgi:glycosyltransferase involved in cell wall biosynthesis